MSKESTEIITKVNDNDIICGRRGLALKHPGNLAYRKVVSLNKELYATCLKNEKLRISKSIVAAMREVGGRFLERVDNETSTAPSEEKDNASGEGVSYRDIGDRRAIEKTSQALREGQPKLLRKLAEKQVRDQAAAAAYGAASSLPLPPPPLNPAVSRGAYEAATQSYHAHAAAAAALSSLSHPSLPPSLRAGRAYEASAAAAPSYAAYPPQYDPRYAAAAAAASYARPAQSVTPPPRTVLPHLVSQFESDLLLLALLRRARDGR